MHGRPRKSLAKPEDEAASAAKAADLRRLQAQFLSNHHNKVYTAEALELSAKLLEKNPESYTAWNYRKLVVEHNIARSDSDPDSIKSIIDQELGLVETALKQNFKSYGAWHHRKWVLCKGHSALDHEMKLLKKLQTLDPRNFHAWNYRRFVAALLSRSEEEELEYTGEMIDKTFSNYSAWHNRSALLSSLVKKKTQDFSSKKKVINDEYEYVHNAIFTDPDDQSGWFYYLWLLDQTVKTDAPHLVSSWPAHGSDIILSGNKPSNDCSLSLFDCFHSGSQTFPLVLYFNEAVEGVNSSTVIIESSFCTGNLNWKPLLQNNSLLSQVWVTRIKFPDPNPHSSEAYQLEVSVGLSHGIISPGGYYIHPTKFAFKVSVHPTETAPAKAIKQGMDIVLWRGENFHAYQTQSQEPDEVVNINQLNVNDVHEPTDSKWRAETIAKEIALFRELLSEINCKIGKLTLARLLTAHDRILSPCTNKMVHSEEVLGLYTDLIKLDPSHSQYYKDEHSLTFLQQVTSNREALLRHCFNYQTLASSSYGNDICLRLSNLSLSRIGSIEKLLWVQMLDLSHNELLSIEGLEAMQLLSCLNLSNNKLGSFTALGPLKMLKSLQVLDVSHNEIGSHTIDTTRYLCSTPLSHTEETSWNGDEISTGDASAKNYWEAFLIFKSTRLMQLSVVGNAISGDNFKSFVVKLVPTLEWLDGDKLQ